MISIRPFETTDTHRYQEFIDAHPDACSYHMPAWWQVLRKTYGYKPATLLAVEGESIVGVLPLMRVHGLVKGRRLVSLPFSHAVPILTTHPDAQQGLLDAAIQLAQDGNYRYLELRPRQPLDDARFQPSTLNYISELDLSPDRGDLFRDFTASNRRNIRKAEKSGFDIREGKTEADFQSFYDLEVATRMHQGAPVYSRQFFPAIRNMMGDDWRLYLLSYQFQDVAGILVLRRGNICIYGYGAWLRLDALKRLYPMNLLVWHALINAKLDGYGVFDFGTTPMHNEGLLEFKQRYNPALSELPYWYFLNGQDEVPSIKRDSGSVKLAEAVLKRLPRWAFTRLSPLLLREVG